MYVDKNSCETQFVISTLKKLRIVDRHEGKVYKCFADS